MRYLDVRTISYFPGGGGVMMKSYSAATACATLQRTLFSGMVSVNSGEVLRYASRSPTSSPLTLAW
jgi:hypothetical protein